MCVFFFTTVRYRKVIKPSVTNEDKRQRTAGNFINEWPKTPQQENELIADNETITHSLLQVLRLNKAMYVFIAKPMQ